MRKALSFALLFSFVVTIMVPLTGIHPHKLASTVFFLLCLLHTAVYRKQLSMRRWLLLLLIVLSFLTGLFGMVFQQLPLLLLLHRALSIALVFFLAIHIFLFHKKLFAPKPASFR